MNCEIDINELKSIKRHLSITWDDEDTDLRVTEMMEDAKVALSDKLGMEVDFTVPGPERALFRNYMLYAWNECLDDFDDAYKSEIYQIRKKRGMLPC